MYNVTNEVIHLVDEDTTNERLGRLIADLALKLTDFFNAAGFDVKANSALTASNLNCGKADYRYALCEIYTRENISVDNIVLLASLTASKGNYANSAEARKNEADHLMRRFGVQSPSALLYWYLIWVARAIVIRLWREKLILLPVNLRPKFKANEYCEFVQFRSSNHRSKPPMYHATEDEVEKLRRTFSRVFFDLDNASAIEAEFFEHNLSAGNAEFVPASGIVYCGDHYAVSDMRTESFDDLSRLSEVQARAKIATQHERIALKQLATCELPGNEYIRQLGLFKQFCVDNSNLLKSDTLAGHTRRITEQLKKDLFAKQTASSFNYEAVISNKDETALFEFFVKANFETIEKMMTSNIMAKNPDFAIWEKYKAKQFTRQATTQSRRNAANSAWNQILTYLTYVQAWIEMHPGAAQEHAIEFPTHLINLDRETFIIRSYENEGIKPDTWPRSLAEFLLRQPSQYATHVRACIFDTCENYRYQKEHVGPSSLLLEGEFTQHWHKKANGVDVGGHLHSVKNIIKKQHFATVLEVAYTLESLGVYLQDQVLTGAKPESIGYSKISEDARSPYQIIRLSEQSGYVPIVWMLDDTLKHQYKRLDQVVSILPDIYAMHSRNCVEVNGKKFVLPCLGMIRGFIFALEQGVRHIHVRYLDAEKFDLYVDKSTAFKGITEVLIGTDKSTREWRAPVHLDVIALLWAERNILRQRSDAASKKKIKYPSTNQTIDVLFRNPSGAVFDEGVWNDNWTNFLTIAQAVVNATLPEGSGPCELVRIVPTSKESPVDATVLSKDITAESKYVTNALAHTPEQLAKYSYLDAPATRVRTQAIVSPHGSRTTFISHRILTTNLHTLARIVNHKNLATTNYYGKVESVELQTVMHESREALKRQKSQKTRLSSSSIAMNSGVKKAFGADRVATAATYGFTSIPILQVDSFGEPIQKASGIDMLRDAPEAMIAFTATHVCPFNMECPEDIVAENGGWQRCGVCRAKVCHVDNLVSINRKVQQLSIDACGIAKRTIGQINNPLKDNAKQRAEVDALKEENQIVTKELLGWEMARNVVEAKRKLLQKEGATSPSSKFIIPAPTLLSESIVCEEAEQRFAEMFFDHMMTLDDMPSLNSKEIEPTVNRIVRKLMKQAVETTPDEINFIMKTFLDASLDQTHLLSPVIQMVDAGVINKQQVYDALESTLDVAPSLPQNKVQKTVNEALHIGIKKRVG